MSVIERINQNQKTIESVRPFEGRMLEQIRAFYRVGLTWSSNALEGNSLTESETKVLLEDGLTVGGKPLRDTFEATGHAEAYDFMFTLLGKRDINEQEILTLHRMFYQNIDQKNAGSYRDIPVFISGSQHPVTAPADIPAEMERLLEWAAGSKRYHPVEFAAMLHKRFVFIHPFVDGNGRVARLLMNTALIQRGYLPAVIPPILRHEYISLLEKAHTDEKPFIEFIAERELESQKDLMRMLHLKPEQERNQTPGPTFE